MAMGTRRLHEVPPGTPADQAADGRRRALESRCGVHLQTTGRYSMDVSIAKCENLIGVTQIPLGVVGPLIVRGAYTDAQEEIFVPLATTEGGLIASTARGCPAVREGCGAIVHVEDMGMTRAPVFGSTGILQTRKFLSWIAEHAAD